MTPLKIPLFFHSLLCLLGLVLLLPGENPPDFESQLLLQLNALRAAETLPPLALDPKLQALALEWSTHLSQEQRAFHRSSSSLIDFLKKESYSFLSENLHNSSQGNNPAFVLQRWMNSPVHRKNLLQPKITQMGIASTQGKDGVWYVVWNGGTPQP